MLPLFASKQTFARIVFLQQGLRLVRRKGTFNVKLIPKTRQKERLFRINTHGNDKQNMRACNGQCEQLQCMLLTANGNSIVERKK